MNTKLNYDPVTGVFTWVISPARNVRVGAVAGSLRKDGYRHIKIDGKLHLAHRIAWFFVHGNWPVNQIDHINGIKDDNRISNLRLATSAENHQNRGKQRNNTSGYTGVNWDKPAGKWRAEIIVNGKLTYLGVFSDKEEAKQVREDAKAKYHGFNPVQR
jgi:hypothetical protein